MIADLLEAVDLLPDHVAASDDPSVLREIAGPSITMALWRRGVPDRLASMVREGDHGDFTVLRVAGNVDSLAEDLVCRLVKAGLGPGTAAVLAPDIVSLARHFAAAMGHGLLDIRLERITGNACKTFHADYVGARLITTYLGRATEWLDQDSAARLPDDRNPAGFPIRSLGTGDVALLKGRLWAGDAALIHRSPPIAGTGEQRLLLVINPAEPGEAS